jgi:putative mannosyltransferase
LDSFCPVFRPDTPVGTLRHLLPLPPRPQPDGWWTWPNVREAQRRLAAEVAAAPPPPHDFAGRGVVVVGGGRYAASAYVTVRVLRRVGCELPVQVWHLAGEMDEAMRRLLLAEGATPVNADEVRRERPFRFLDGHWWKGWQLKPYAIAHCPFREVLLLDADCYPARDPTFLFDGPQYRACGAVFWPDLTASAGSLTAEMIRTFGIDPDGLGPIESGQLLIDKGRCWPELALALHYNAQADFTYRIIHGDKDTFPLAWRRRGRAYATLWPTADWDVHTVLHYDGDGRVLFQHRVQDKFKLTPTPFLSSYQQSPATNRRHPRLAHEDFCFGVLEELRRKWRCWWHELAARWRPGDPGRPAEEARRHYQVKYDVAARLRPARVAGIGVRAGCSAFAFLSACPDAAYVGVVPDGRAAPDCALLDGFDATFLHGDAGRTAELPGRFDLAHVDGDGGWAGRLGDLAAAARAARHVLVDGYGHPEVREACRAFLAARPDAAAESIDDGLGGLLLLDVDRGSADVR